MTNRARPLPAGVVLVLLCSAQASAQIGRLTGQVKNDRNEPVAGAAVLAENADAAPDSFKTKTDGKGRFAMIGLRNGVWTLTVIAPGHDPARIAVRVSSARLNAPVDLRLTKRVPPSSALNGLSVSELEARLDQADALLSERQPDAALAIYRELLARVPALTTLNLQIGRACRLKGDVECAVASFEATVSGGAGSAAALLELTELAMERSDQQAARAYANRLAELAPGSPEAQRAASLVEPQKP